MDKTWSVSLVSPDIEPIIDITIYMDVSLNPGPDKEQDTTNSLHGTSISTNVASVNSISYTRETLLSLRLSYKVCRNDRIVNDLKRTGLFHYRGKRGGKSRSNKSNYYSDAIRQSIPTRITNYHCLKRPITDRGPRLLVSIPRAPKQPCPVNLGEQYPVPKCLFLNICSLTKTKNRVKAHNACFGSGFVWCGHVCVVSETHLNPKVPDANVT
jgi:hypothetical protein